MLWAESDLILDLSHVNIELCRKTLLQEKELACLVTATPLKCPLMANVISAPPPIGLQFKTIKHLSSAFIIFRLSLAGLFVESQHGGR